METFRDICTVYDMFHHYSSSPGDPACSRSTWHPGISYWDISRHLPAVASVESDWTSAPQPWPGTDQHSVWGLPQVCVHGPGQTRLAQREVHTAQVRRTGIVFVDIKSVVTVCSTLSGQFWWTSSFYLARGAVCLSVSRLKVGPMVSLWCRQHHHVAVYTALYILTHNLWTRRYRS